MAPSADGSVELYGVEGGGAVVADGGLFPGAGADRGEYTGPVMRRRTVSSVGLVLIMLMLVEALLVRSAVLVTHDHPAGPDGVGPAIGMAEGFEVQPLPRQGQAYESPHGLLTAIGLDDDYRPRVGGGLGVAPAARFSFVLRDAGGPVLAGVVPARSHGRLVPGLRSTVLRL